MKPSVWVVAALCLYLLLEAVLDTRGRGAHAQAHPHRTMMVAVVMTLVAAAAVLYERGY